MYIGLAPEYRDSGSPYSSDNFSRYRFRIRQITADGTNPIVHGPFTIDNNNANLNSYADAEFGVYELGAQQFGDSIYVFRPGVIGEFSIEFDEFTNDGSARVNIPFWDFTVIRDGAPVEGRLWSRGWAFRTPLVNGTIEPDCVWDRQFNGELYSYTEDGFVSRIGFLNSGFQGLSFNIAFNESGPGNNNDIALDRMSVPGINATDGAAQHRIFLDLPDINLFPDGICGEVDAGESFICGGVDPYCLNVEVTRPGQVDILLDFNGNGILDDGSQDVSLVYEFTTGNLSTCVPWNGLRGDSTQVDFTDTVDVIINYAQGIQHWSGYDIEFMKNGFCVETIRPTCAQAISTDNLFWDDRNIPQEPGTGAPKDNRTGAGCNDTPRTWDFFELNSDVCDDFDDALTAGYGDKNTLNTWWFANSQSEFRARLPVISAVITGPTSLCAGDTSVLVAMDQALSGSVIFDWSGPGVDTVTTSTVRVTLSGEYCVSIGDELGCTNETCVTVTVLDFESDQFPPNLAICFGDSIKVPTAGDPNFTYSWTPSEGISSTNSNEPTFNPEVTTTYIATISGASSNGQICEVMEQIVVEVYPEIGLQVFGGGPICDPTTTITATTQSPATIVLFDPNGDQIGTGTEFTVAVSGEANYTIVATSIQGCVDSAIFTVSGGPVDITLPDSVLTCLSDGVSLGVTNLDENDTLSYVWAPAELFTPASVTTANPVFAGTEGDYVVTVTVTNQYGCEAEEDVQLIVIDDSGVLSFVPDVDCDGTTVTFNNTSTTSFGYIWNFGDGNTSMEASPVHVYGSVGTFTVTLDLIYDQTCVTSVSEDVTTFETLLDADMSFTFGNCDNGSATLTFSDESFNATGGVLIYNWTFTGGTPMTSDVANPIVTVTESGTVTGSLEVLSADGCSSTIDTSFTVNLAIVSLVEEIIICPGDSTALNPDGNPDLTYSWSPSPDFDPTAVNPTTSTAGTYIVTVTTSNADFNCESIDTVTVVIPDSIGLVINGPDGPVNGTIELPTIATCGESVDLMIDLVTNDDVDITYTDLDGNILGTGPTLTVSPDGSDTIVVTAVSEFGCIEMDTVVIINNEVNVGIDVGADGLNFCSSTDTVVTVMNFDLTDELTYDWTPNDIINGALDGESVDITSPAEGSIDLMVTVSNQFGCDTMITITVEAVLFTPNDYPEIITPCFDEPFTINGGDAVAGYDYDWSPADNLDLSDPANPVGTFTEDVVLTVIITDPLTGCTETHMIEVVVAPEISFSVDPAQTDICGTGSILITGSSVNDDVVITWYSDPELTDEVGTGPVFTIDANMMDQSFTVYGQAVDTITGCSQSLPATVTTTVFTPNQYPPVTTPCFGDEFTIEGGDAVMGYIYEWSPSGNLDLSDPANPVGTFTEDVVLTVTITDTLAGCSETQMIEVDVAPEISFNVDPAQTDICGTGSVPITGSSVNADVVITWYSDSELTDQVGTGSVFIIDANMMGQSFTVYGQAVDTITGCSQSLPATVNTTVFNPNQYPPVITPCFGDEFTIEGGDAVTDYTYEWSPSDNLDLSDPANPVGTFMEDVVLTVTITDTLTGCTEIQMIEVDVAPEISFGVDPAQTNICGTGSVPITGSSVNDDVVITWYSDPELTDEVGTGSVFIIDANMMGQSFTVFGQAVDTITGCSQSLPATVNTTVFNPNQYPSVIIPCFGDEFTIEGGDAVAGYTYEWSPSDNLDLTDPANPVGVFTESGTVSVTITDSATGCTETQSVQVDVTPEIDFMTSPSDTTLCEPAMVTVEGSSVNIDAEIVWYDDEALTMEVGMGSTYTIDAAEPGASYTVYGVATDSVTGCQQIVPVTVLVSELNAGLPLDSLGACVGETPPIFGANGPSADLEYDYEPAGSIDDSDPANPIFVGTESTDVTVTITDPATGCTAMIVIDVDITDLSGLGGFANPDEIFVGESSELTVTGCDDCGYEWFPQDGTVNPTSGSAIVTATPDEEGTMLYQIEVTKNGCMEVVEIELRVLDPICDLEHVYVPNAFTPNGDGQNDEMMVRSKFAEQITEFRFIIHNRWGQEVYSSDSIFDSWDGTSEGDDLEPDVYGYYLRVVCPTGEELIQKGNITILR
jgi:gliding motility-associated-like protein